MPQRQNVTVLATTRIGVYHTSEYHRTVPAIPTTQSKRRAARGPYFPILLATFGARLGFLLQPTTVALPDITAVPTIQLP